MKRTALALAIAGLAGCADMRPTEYAFHAFNAVDAVQTISIGKSECYHEVAPITAQVLGDHPKAGETVAYFAGVSVIHYAVSRWLDANNVPRGVGMIFDLLTTGVKLGTVAHNYGEGIRLDSNDNPRQPPQCN